MPRRTKSTPSVFEPHQANDGPDYRFWTRFCFDLSASRRSIVRRTAVLFRYFLRQVGIFCSGIRFDPSTRSQRNALFIGAAVSSQQIEAATSAKQAAVRLRRKYGAHTRFRCELDDTRESKRFATYPYPSTIQIDLLRRRARLGVGRFEGAQLTRLALQTNSQKIQRHDPGHYPTPGATLQLRHRRRTILPLLQQSTADSQIRKPRPHRAGRIP